MVTKRATNKPNGLSWRGTVSSVFTGAGVLTVVITTAVVVCGPIAYITAGSLGVTACGLSAVICLVAGISALLVSASLRGTPIAHHGIFLGMAFRMILPLASVAVLFYQPSLVRAGMVYYLVVFYLIMLATDVILELQLLAPREKQRESMR